MSDLNISIPKNSTISLDKKLDNHQYRRLDADEKDNEKEINMEEILLEINEESSRYQLISLFIFCYAFLSIGFQSMTLIFLFLSPDFFCESENGGNLLTIKITF